MTSESDNLENVLRGISEDTFAGDDHQDRLKIQLLQQHAGAMAPPFYRRHQVSVLLLLGLLILGGGFAATRALLRVFRYDITLESDGLVLAAPRILVNEGQAARMTLTNADGTIHIVSIDENGNVTYQGNDESVQLNVDVTETSNPAVLLTDPTRPVDSDPAPLDSASSETSAPTQLLYYLELTRNDEVMAQPRVLVLQGQSAEITITDEQGIVHVTTIHEDGSVTYSGDPAVTVDFRVEVFLPETALDDNQ